MVDRTGCCLCFQDGGQVAEVRTIQGSVAGAVGLVNGMQRSKRNPNRGSKAPKYIGQVERGQGSTQRPSNQSS